MESIQLTRANKRPKVKKAPGGNTMITQEGQAAAVEARNGMAVRLTVPAAGFVVYE